MRKELIEELRKYKEELQTVSIEKTDTDPQFLSIDSYICKLGNGHSIRRERLLKNRSDGSAVIIFPVTDEGEVILAVESREFTKETIDIGLPAGYIESEENPIEAARRELLEETGYIADKLIEVGSFYQDQGCSSAYNHYYVGLDCKMIGNQNLDKGEFIKIIKVRLEEVDELLNMGYIQGLNSAYAILKGKEYIKAR